MKLKKRAAALVAAILLASTLAVPASAHGWGHHGARGSNGYDCGITAAANQLCETARQATRRLQSEAGNPCLLMEQASWVQSFQAEVRRARAGRLAANTRNVLAGDSANPNCPNGNGVCDGTGPKGPNGNGVCDGTGPKGPNGNGVCDGTGPKGPNGNGVCDGTGPKGPNGNGGGHHGGGHCRNR